MVDNVVNHSARILYLHCSCGGSYFHFYISHDINKNKKHKKTEHVTDRYYYYKLLLNYIH